MSNAIFMIVAWVGECFFWYRLTRVVLDKFHRAVKQLCVCVCGMSRGPSASAELHVITAVTTLITYEQMNVSCNVSVVVMNTRQSVCELKDYSQTDINSLSLSTNKTWRWRLASSSGNRCQKTDQKTRQRPAKQTKQLTSNEDQCLLSNHSVTESQSPVITVFTMLSPLRGYSISWIQSPILFCL